MGHHPFTLTDSHCKVGIQTAYSHVSTMSKVKVELLIKTW